MVKPLSSCSLALFFLGCQSSPNDGASSASSAASVSSGPSVAASTKTPPAWSPTPPPAAPKGPLKITVEGAEVAFPYGRVEVDFGTGNGVIRLSDKPLACTGSDPSDATTIGVPIEPGPGGKYILGTPMTVPGAIATGPAIKTPWDGRTVTLTLAEVSAEAGKRVKGAIAVDMLAEADPSKPIAKGGGELDLEVCAALAPKQVKLPELATTPLEGKIAGAPFTPKTVLARVVKIPGGNAIDTIFLFPDAADCSSMMDAFSGRRAAVLVSVSGLNDRLNLSGAPQPASLSLSKLPESTRSTTYGGIESNTWVEVEKLAFKPGDTVRGRLVSMTHSDPKPAVEHALNGVFEAKLCE